MAKELRTYIPLQQALEDARNRYGFPEDYGITACYDIENMGFCADGKRGGITLFPLMGFLPTP